MKKIRGSFCERVVAPKSAFDRRSFRWKKSGRSWILVGCPKKHWRRDRCTVGTRAHVVLTKSHGRCSIGRRIQKGGLGTPRKPRVRPVRVLTLEQQATRDLLFKILAPDFKRYLQSKSVKLNGHRRRIQK